MAEYLYFNSRDELLRVDLQNVVYFEADGNYTKIILANGYNTIVSMNLGKMESLISKRLQGKKSKFARVGKFYIVNLSFLFKISTVKQQLLLSDQRDFIYTLDISKIALKNLKDLIVNKEQ